MLFFPISRCDFYVIFGAFLAQNFVLRHLWNGRSMSKIEESGVHVCFFSIVILGRYPQTSKCDFYAIFGGISWPKLHFEAYRGHLCNIVNTNKCLVGIYMWWQQKTFVIFGALYLWRDTSSVCCIFGALFWCAASIVHLWYNMSLVGCMSGAMHLWWGDSLVHYIFGASLVHYIFDGMRLWYGESLVC